MRFPSPSNVKRVDNNNKRYIIKTMKPSTKEFAIEAELANLFGFYRGVHIAVDECVPEPIGCGGPATEFEDDVEKEKNAKRRALNSNSGATEEQWKRWKEKGLSSH